MASNDQKSVTRTNNKTYWTRKYVFACKHSVVGYCRVNTLTETKISEGKGHLTMTVPFLLPVRVPRNCSACIRQSMFDSVQAKATAVRASLKSLNSLCAKMERLKTEPIFFGDDEDVDDEDWPEQPPTLESLSRFYALPNKAMTDLTMGKGKDTATVDSPPKEKLSDRIRSLRQDLERRRQSWGQNKTKKQDVAGASE